MKTNVLHRYSNQNVVNTTFSVQTAHIETADWFYSVSDVEPFREGFKFTFTDDAKTGSYLVAQEFFAEKQKDLNVWSITGQELLYIDGDDQSKVGLYLEFANPFVLEGLK